MLPELSLQPWQSIHCTTKILHLDVRRRNRGELAEKFFE